MRCDYWTLMSQPKRFVELFDMYLSVEAKVKEEFYKKSEQQAKRMKSKAGGIKRGR